MSRQDLDPYVRSALLRGFLLTAGWWALTGGDTSSWTVGVPVVALATAVSVVVHPPRPEQWTILGALRYAVFFVWGSLLGGFDVALRAIRPSMPISPGLLRYPFRLPPGAPRALFRITLSLMPGSLGTHMDNEDELVVHVLVFDQETNLRDLRELEWQVARLFRLDLTEGGAPPGAARA